nr:minor coat protein [Allamanda chlorotic virus A]
MSNNSLTDSYSLDKTYRIYHVWRTVENFYDSFSVRFTYPDHDIVDGHLLFQFWYGNRDLNVEVLVRKVINSKRLEVLAGSWFAKNFNFFHVATPPNPTSFFVDGVREHTLSLHNPYASTFIISLDGTELVRSIKAIPYQKVVFGYELQVDLPDNLNVPLKNLLPQISGLLEPKFVGFKPSVPIAYERMVSETTINSSSNPITSKEIVELKNLRRVYDEVILPKIPKPFVQERTDGPKLSTAPHSTTLPAVNSNDYTKKLVTPVSMNLNSLFSFSGTDFDEFKLSDDDLPTSSTINVPGLLTKDQLNRTVGNLSKFFKSKYNTDSKILLNKCMICLLQMAIINTTNSSSQQREESSVSYKGFNILFSYKECCDVIKSSLKDSNYPNPVRVFLRHCSSLCTTLLEKGIIKPNLKLVAKYGIPERFYPYCFDFSLVNTIEHGIDAVIANLLAKVIAIKHSTINNKPVHSALELIDKVSVLNL